MRGRLYPISVQIRELSYSSYWTALFKTVVMTAGCGFKLTPLLADSVTLSLPPGQ
jgi:hypothetical protein